VKSVRRGRGSGGHIVYNINTGTAQHICNVAACPILASSIERRTLLLCRGADGGHDKFPYTPQVNSDMSYVSNWIKP